MKAVVNSQGDIIALVADDAPRVVRVAGAMAYNPVSRQYDQPVNVVEYKTTRNRKVLEAALQQDGWLIESPAKGYYTYADQ